MTMTNDGAPASSSTTTAMSNDSVYVERNPGDQITAGDWNLMQELIQEDIETKAAEAASAITHVQSATDAEQLDGKGLDALIDEIRKRVLESIRGESGYRKIFKVLEEGDDEFDVIEHNLGDHPLVDLYELLYFEVACADDDDIYRTVTTFYLHHESEERIRVTEKGERVVVHIQPDVPVRVGIPFADMLAQYDVSYNDSTSLGDLETEFWKAFFSSPNDRFNDDQYCHSPWFERCCREERDVASLKARGDWDDLVFQMRPAKIVGGPVKEVKAKPNEPKDETKTLEWAYLPTPANVGVGHTDLNTLILWLNGKAFQTPQPTGRVNDRDQPVMVKIPDEFRDELKLMVLLRA